MRTLILVVSLMTACAAQADVYKCTDKSGRKFYQDRPCADEQKAEPFDPGANVTTIDSETSRREAQGALITREQSRERRVEVVTPASSDTRVTITEQGGEPRSGYYDGVGGYPVYRDDDRRRDRRRDREDDRGRPRRPDETPMHDTTRRDGGSNYVPAPPTARQVAPRGPSTGARRQDVERDR